MTSIADGTTARPAASEQSPPTIARQNEGSLPLPSSFAPPTRVDDLPQQASTQPGDGTTVRTDATHPSQQVHDSGYRYEGAKAPPRDSGTTRVPFKEQVIGVAQKARGTLLRKPELKEHGEKILGGETTHEQDR